MRIPLKKSRKRKARVVDEMDSKHEDGDEDEDRVL